MDKLLIIDKDKLNLNFREDANCWQTKATIGDKELTIEIDFQFFRQTNIDWDHFSDFIRFIDKKDRIKDLVEASLSLVLELGKTFFRHSPNISNWTMKFRSAIYYNGRPGERNNKHKHSYSLMFDFFETKDNLTFGDEYGLYLVDIEDLQIVGVRRHQC